jgi:uncharacterized membrane protein
MVIFFAFLFAIVVLGYLLITELADDSRAENCMMEHRKNCGAIEWPSHDKGSAASPTSGSGPY